MCSRRPSQGEVRENQQFKIPKFLKVDEQDDEKVVKRRAPRSSGEARWLGGACDSWLMIALSLIHI